MSAHFFSPHYRFDTAENIPDVFADVPFLRPPVPSTKDGLMVSVKSPLGDDLLFDAFIGTEAISELFEYS
ncbi:hypothetical protein AGMMS50296_9060 [Alphaproteobacteria bacterium]|nr:hypothetical protein AGMMS50296_9060 [Alphaproteobacteria bacterium]